LILIIAAIVTCNTITASDPRSVLNDERVAGPF
jgi:hypothetical protein